MKKHNSISKKLPFTALFAALCLIGTILIAIPMPFGYFNVGDVFVLLAGWCLGPLYGPIAAGLGSALADVISGFPLYVPATFFIKAFDAFIAYMVWAFIKKFIKKEQLDFLPRFLSAVLGEMMMAAGYFLYDGILFGFAAAAGSILGNVTQAVVCLLLAPLVAAPLYHTNAVRKRLPHLYS